MRHSIGAASLGLATLALVAFIASSLGGAAPSQAEATGDAVKGKKIFARCGACHSTDAGVNKVGPSLHGIIGRPSGSIADFTYSDAMKNSHLTWDEATLDKYLTSPKKFAPGTKMAFPGLPKAQDRANLLRWLRDQSDSPVPLPQ